MLEGNFKKSQRNKLLGRQYVNKFGGGGRGSEKELKKSGKWGMSVFGICIIKF